MLLCRTKFAHLRFLRKGDPEDDIEENVVVYLVDAHELAVPDQDAKDVLAKAASAATTEIEAKKVDFATESLHPTVVTRWISLQKHCYPMQCTLVAPLCFSK